MGQVQVMAHRGASRSESENTLAAFRRAGEMGAQSVELDVRRTLDGVPLVIHDTTFARTTTCAGGVAARDAGSVRRR